ncbi:hypothetical protein NPIL_25681 [Nephila pilipes]|uniref:Uncharacterized protein n=1 Tax=Nephila pilipes TaxID=299642 RepID=A0A8X6UR91_NEPPI|nr:hypothetical protein NPIL_25681 [Nephila pilipes]
MVESPGFKMWSPTLMWKAYLCGTQNRRLPFDTRDQGQLGLFTRGVLFFDNDARPPIARDTKKKIFVSPHGLTVTTFLLHCSQHYPDTFRSNKEVQQIVKNFL